MIARRPRVLVVEDNTLNMELVRDLLSMLDVAVDVAEATSAETAIQMATERPPDLILLDIRLPGMDGYAAVKRLKQNPGTGAVPVIALTADAMKDTESAARSAGFDDYLTKPIDLARFQRVVGARLRPEEPRG